MPDAPAQRPNNLGPSWTEENRLRAQGHAVIAGVDEAGRGCLAGPVVAAAVILPVGWQGVVCDSKRLTSNQRAECYDALIATRGVRWAIGCVDVRDIDRINILRAAHRAMCLAVEKLGEQPNAALVDGLPFQPFPVPMSAIVKGDARCMSIAAASIVAKVTRDRMMEALDCEFPGYGFAQHKAYGTPDHLDALQRLGPCAQHRRSFAPVAAHFAKPKSDQLILPY